MAEKELAEKSAKEAEQLKKDSEGIAIPTSEDIADFDAEMAETGGNAKAEDDRPRPAARYAS